MRFLPFLSHNSLLRFVPLPEQIIRLGSRLVLGNEITYHLPGIIQLGQVILEHVLLLKLIQEGATLPQLVVLIQAPLKQRTNTRVIGQHQPRHTVIRLDIGTGPRESHLQIRRSPWNKLGQFLLPDPLQRLVHLSGVHLALDNVQNRNVTMMVRFVIARRHHHVLGLQQTTHNIQNCGFTNTRCLKKENKM